MTDRTPYLFRVLIAPAEALWRVADVVRAVGDAIVAVGDVVSDAGHLASRAGGIVGAGVELVSARVDLARMRRRCLPVELCDTDDLESMADDVARELRARRYAAEPVEVTIPRVNGSHG